MNHAQIRAVIFDLDGLLIDSEIISYRLYQELLRPYGHNLTLEDYASGYSGKTAPENMRKAVETFGLPFRVEEGLEKIFAMERELSSFLITWCSGTRWSGASPGRIFS